ncbi:hypothetical protein DmGdi_16210 [Gluconobacter sp. Gdi]|nr:hypothetical protein DmGdi_16210 [Gluconobacter sp. Gdi]
MSPLVEKFWPICLAIGCAVLWHLLKLNFPKDPSGLLSTSATLAAVFAGFLGVTQGLILTIKDSKIYATLKKNGLLTLMFKYLQSGISASVIFAIVSVVGFFINPECIYYNFHIFSIFQCIWIASSIYSFGTYTRITNITFKLLHQV